MIPFCFLIRNVYAQVGCSGRRPRNRNSFVIGLDGPIDVLLTPVPHFYEWEGTRDTNVVHQACGELHLDCRLKVGAADLNQSHLIRKEWSEQVVIALPSEHVDLKDDSRQRGSRPLLIPPHQLNSNDLRKTEGSHSLVPVFEEYCG